MKDKKAFWKTIKLHYKLILGVALFHTFIQYFFFYLGIARVPGALGAIVIGSGPLFIAVMAHFFMPGDTMTLKKTAVILLGLSGVIMVVLGRANISTLELSFLIGVLFLLICNVNAGVSNILIARYTASLPPLVLSSSSLALGGIGLFLISVPFEGLSLQTYPQEYYLSLAWLSFISAGALSIWVALLKRPTVKVSDLNLWKFIIPVFGAILSWVILPDESPELLSVIGMVLTGVSLILVNYLNRKKAQKTAKANK